jgi:hypothetical protein
MTTTTQSSPAADVTEEAIQAFADRVRAALRDLPEGDVVELTEGLEASLAEQAADSSPGSALPHDGDAVAYAAELRDAAGLPAAGAVTGKTSVVSGAVDVVRTRVRERAAAAAEWVRTKPLLGPLFQIAVTLQPVWWVLRVFVAYWLLQGFTQGHIYSPVPYISEWLIWFVLLTAVVVSVQWGRGKWLPWRWLADIRSLASLYLFVFALSMVPSVGSNLYDGAYMAGYAQGEDDAIAYSANTGDAGYAGDTGATGMVSDGEPVENIFAFDAQGKPLTEVQLFDQAGRPLVTVQVPNETRYLNTFPTGDRAAPLTLVPRPIGSGMNAWNIFPLQRLPEGELDYSKDPTGVFDIAKAEPTSPPKITVYPLVPLDGQAKADTKPTETTAPLKKPTP